MGWGSRGNCQWRTFLELKRLWMNKCWFSWDFIVYCIMAHVAYYNYFKEIEDLDFMLRLGYLLVFVLIALQNTTTHPLMNKELKHCNFYLKS